MSILTSNGHRPVLPTDGTLDSEQLQQQLESGEFPPVNLYDVTGYLEGTARVGINGEWHEASWRLLGDLAWMTSCDPCCVQVCAPVIDGKPDLPKARIVNLIAAGFKSAVRMERLVQLSVSRRNRQFQDVTHYETGLVPLVAASMKPHVAYLQMVNMEPAITKVELRAEGVSAAEQKQVMDKGSHRINLFWEQTREEEERQHELSPYE